MRRFTPVNFTDVSIEGEFWRERLDTVLDAHHPEPARAARRARHPRIRSTCRSRLRRSASRSAATTSRPRSSGTPTSASGSRRRATRFSIRRDATIEAQIDDDHRAARHGAASRRLSELLVHRPRDREALDQPPRQPRALLRRPYAGGRHRLFPGDRPAPAARHHAPLRRPHRDGLRHRARARSAAIAGTRRSSSRWSSSTA